MILNLLSVIPVLGDELVAGVLGSSTVVSWSIRRFTVIHFLLGLLALILIVVHLILLHRLSPGKTGNFCTTDGTSTLAIILTKDLMLFALVFGLIF